MTDVSARMLELGLSKSVLESIVGATEVGLVVLGSIGRPLYMNASARRMLRADDGLPQRALRQLDPMLSRVRSTGAVSVERWSCGELVLNARLRSLHRQRSLLLLELSVAHARSGCDIVDTLVLGLRVSKREARLLSHVWRGLRNDEIARLLGVPEGTVKSRLHRLYQRHGLKNRSRAVLAVAEIIGHTSPPAPEGST